MNSTVVLHLLMHMPWPPDDAAGSPRLSSAALMKEEYYDQDCRGIFGCFPTGSPWQGRERVVSLRPMTIEEIDPRFTLYSKQNPSGHKIGIFDAASIDSTRISKSSKLVVLTHGFLQYAKILWLQNLVTLILSSTGDENTFVMTVDWRGGSKPPYAQAVANTRFVGAITGRILHLLMDRKGLLDINIHLVGHSLGSHLFGYAGSYVKRRALGSVVGRITGLDPAGPYFRGEPPEVRLDKSDARMVVGIQTDSTALFPTLPESLGIGEAIGDIDFFPDGGGLQGGCDPPPQIHIMNSMNSIIKYVACNHMKSIQYFTASLDKNCRFIGVECPSWGAFQRGDCWDCTKRRCYSMGYHLERFLPLGKRMNATSAMSSGANETMKLYLKTTSSGKLCGSQVRLTVVPEASKEALLLEGDRVRVSVTLRGSRGTAAISPPDNTVVQLPAKGPSTWVAAVTEIGEVQSIIFQYVVEKGLIQSIFWNPITRFLHLDKIIYEELATAKKLVFYFCEDALRPQEAYILKTQRCRRKHKRSRFRKG